MFKQFVQNAQGIDTYLIFSMIVFMLFFIGVLSYIFLMKRETVDEISRLPLTDSDNNINESSNEKL